MKNNLQEKDNERRIAYQEQIKQEVPRLKNINSVLTYDYFKYGWDAAMAHQHREHIKNANIKSNS